MGDLPYNTVLVATVENRHDGTIEVQQRHARLRPMREETWIDGRLADVDHYNDVVMTDRTATFETKLVDVVFEDGTRIRAEGRRLLDGDVLLFARHRGTNGDVDDVFDVRRHEWHHCGVDRAPPVRRRLVALVMVACALVLHSAGRDPGRVIAWSLGTGAVAVLLDRVLVGWRKVMLHLHQRRTGAEMRRMLRRAANASA